MQQIRQQKTASEFVGQPAYATPSDSSSVPCRQHFFTISVWQSKALFLCEWVCVCALPTSDTTKGLIFIRQEENPTFRQAERLCITSQRLGLRSTGKDGTKVGKGIFHTNVAGKALHSRVRSRVSTVIITCTHNMQTYYALIVLRGRTSNTGKHMVKYWQALSV